MHPHPLACECRIAKHFPPDRSSSEVLDRLYMQITAFMRSTGDRKFTRCKAKVFHTAALDKGKHLQWFCAGAQKGDRLRVAIRKDQLAVCIYNCDRTMMHGFYNLPPCDFKERLCCHCSSRT